MTFLDLLLAVQDIQSLGLRKAMLYFLNHGKVSLPEDYFILIQDCWARPICSAPAARIELMERTSTNHNCTLHLSGKTMNCLNLGSYNYLGFADDWKQTCRNDVFKALDNWPISMSSSRMDMGTVALHLQLENTVARFVGKEAAFIFAMGYGTNATVIPTLMGPGSLIISDSLNHTSIVNGSRSSPAQNSCISSQ